MENESLDMHRASPAIIGWSNSTRAVFDLLKQVLLPSFPLKQQPVLVILLPPESSLDERIPALHFVA